MSEQQVIKSVIAAKDEWMERALAAERERDAWRRVAELREEFADVGDLYALYGAEWGDRYAEVQSDLEKAKAKVGLR